MEYLDENDQPINLADISASLTRNENDVPTEEEIIFNLEEAYRQGNKNVTRHDISFAGRGGEIWRKIKKFVCERIDEGTEQDKIAEVVAEALSKVLPGGGIVKVLLKMIVKFIVSKGVGIVCKAN